MFAISRERCVRGRPARDRLFKPSAPKVSTRSTFAHPRASCRLEREPSAEHLDRIERKLGLEAALNICGLEKSVLLAREQEIADRVTLAPQRIDHGLGLVRRQDGTLVALEEDHRLR